MQKGGIKLRRSKYRKTKYAAQYVRTAKNKARAIRKAMAMTKSQAEKDRLDNALKNALMPKRSAD